MTKAAPKKAAPPREVLVLTQLRRMADALERLATLGDLLALRAGVNIHPESHVDESFLGDQPEGDLSEEELLLYKQNEAPPVAPAP